MKLSNETLNIMKNFSEINQGMYFRKGQTLRTVSPQKSILAQAKITEDIPNDFGIYDMNNFLSVISAHADGVDIDIGDKSANIIGNGGRSKINYRFCDSNMIVVAPEKDIVLNDPEISFNLSEEDYSWIKKISSVLQSPNIVIESDGNKVYMSTKDMANDSAHNEALEIGDGNGATYKMVFRTEYFKFIGGSYSVQISSKGIAHFKNVNKDLQYWVTTESTSTFSN